MEIVQEDVVRHFKFLNFWTKKDSFKDVVKGNWTADFEGNPFIVFHHKLMKVEKTLTIWSKETCGNIFQEIVTFGGSKQGYENGV